MIFPHFQIWPSMPLEKGATEAYFAAFYYELVGIGSMTLLRL